MIGTNTRRSSCFEKTGRLVGVQGAIYARVPASIGELLWVREASGELIPAEAIGFNEDQVQILPLATEHRFQKDDLVIASGQAMTVPTGFELLGRVIDATGKPIDSQGVLKTRQSAPLRFRAPTPLERGNITEPFETGIRAIDSLLTVGRGQRIGIFSGSGVGKSTLLGNIAKHARSDVNVVALVGERGREVRPFIEDSLGIEGLSKSVVIVSTSDESALARVRAVESAVAIANWFRNGGKNVLLMMDSVTRFATAQRELGLLLGEPPTSRGYPPSVFQRMASMLEQLGNASRGSITAFITVLVEGDDLNDPVADAARAILDGHIVLDRRIAERNRFPAIDVLASVSRLANELVTDEHHMHAATVRKTVALYRQVEDLVQIGAYKKGSIRATDRAIECMPAIDEFLQQDDLKVSFVDTIAQLSRLAKSCGYE